MPRRSAEPEMQGDPRGDLTAYPFSRRGAWWHFFAPPRAEYQPLGAGLYLRSNRFARLGRRELLRLDLVRDGQVVRHAARFTVARLTLVDGGHDRSGASTSADGKRADHYGAIRGGGAVELVLDGTATAHLRGRGVGLRLGAPGGFGQLVHPTGDGRLVINQHDTLRRILLTVPHGRVRIDAPWQPEGCEHIRIDIEPAEDGTWAASLEEFESTCPAHTNPTSIAATTAFERAAREAVRDWEAFRAPFGAYPRRWAAAAERALHILWSFSVPAEGLLTRPAVLMARGWMDAVWSWDNWFNLCALAPAHPRAALDQALLMADHQDAHGCYPDLVATPFRFYTFHKPPTQGVLLRWLRRYVPGFLSPRVCRALYPTLAAFARWWLANRVWPGRRLCHYLHGNDAGWDNSTLFDGGVPLETADLNAFLIVQAEELALLADELGKRREARAWRAQADALTRALLEDLWDGDAFAAVVLETGQRWRCRSLIPNLPLILGQRLPAVHRRALVHNVERFLTPCGVASEHPESPHYTPDGYWRGPVWAASTWLIVMGLEACGAARLARTIAARFCVTCAAHGFAENFDAFTGERRRDPAYSWTAGIFLSLLRHLPGADAAQARAVRQIGKRAPSRKSM